MTAPAPDWTFVQPSLLRPTGGDIALFEMVNALASLGNGRVRLVHFPFRGERVRSLADLPWFTFHPAVEHHFAGSVTPDAIPDAQLLVYTVKLVDQALSTESGAAGRRTVELLSDPSPRTWSPVLFLQGLRVFAPETERTAIEVPGLKVCVGSWMTKKLVSMGVDRADVVHVPNGLDHDVFRIIRPVHERPAQVAMNLSPHPVKNIGTGIDALDRLHRRRATPAILFGADEPDHALPAELEFRLAPERTAIAEGIYNVSSAYLQPSIAEGFGMCAVEAMACGCALVTTANGGSDDYAVDGETAIVCGPSADDMADALERLLLDEQLRTRIAVNGARHVQQFRWPTSASLLAEFAASRLSS